MNICANTRRDSQQIFFVLDFLSSWIHHPHMPLFPLPPELWLLIVSYLCEGADAAAFRNLFAVDAVARDFRIPVQVWSDCIRQRVLCLTSGLNGWCWNNVFKLTVADTPESMASHKRVARQFKARLQSYVLELFGPLNQRTTIRRLIHPCSKCDTVDKVWAISNSSGNRVYCKCERCDTRWMENNPYLLIRHNLMRSLDLDCPYDEFMKRKPRDVNIIRLSLAMLHADSHTEPVGRNVLFEE